MRQENHSRKMIQFVSHVIFFLTIIVPTFVLHEVSLGLERPNSPGLTSPRPVVGLSTLSDELIHVAEKAQASVVNITVKVEPADFSLSNLFPFLQKFFEKTPTMEEDQPSPDDQEVGGGSGVILRSDGYIITNNHVVDRAYDIRVQLDDHRVFPARIIGTDPQTDLALLKIKASKLTALAWGDSSQLKVGEIVVAIGNPFGFNQTVTMGIVSAIGRGDIGFIDYEDFIQTDAAINPGNSGGALLNLRGELVGINTAIFTETGGTVGIGFAVPSQIAKTVWTLLRENGRVIRGWLGLAVQKMSPELAQWFKAPDTKGVVVTNLAKGGPAERAHLKQGDIIRHYNGSPITSPLSIVFVDLGPLNLELPCRSCDFEMVKPAKST